MRRRAPRPIAAALEELGGELAPQSALTRVQTAWARAVGPQIAAHSQPMTERAGTVTVACDAAVWAAELEMQAPQLLATLNAILGAGSEVMQLRFKTR